MLLRRYHRIHRHGQDQPRGLVLTHEVDGNLQFGWSLCDSEDQFTYRDANAFALERMKNDGLIAPINDVTAIRAVIEKMPHTLRKYAASSAAQLIRYSLT